MTCEEVSQEMRDCMAAVSFFIQHPIRLIRDIDATQGRISVLLDTLRYTGDHPAFSREKIEFPMPLPKHTLYIEISKDNWLPLYPLISVQYCPECKAEETYFIDGWQGMHKPAKLKSFERGHPTDSDEVGRELRKWIM
jgi:hypothetical protein